MQILPYDGCAEFYSRSAEELIAFMWYFQTGERIIRCGNRCVDIVKEYRVMVGYDNLISDHAIPGTRGNDGVLLGDGRLETSSHDANA